MGVDSTNLMGMVASTLMELDRRKTKPGSQSSVCWYILVYVGVYTKLATLKESWKLVRTMPAGERDGQR